MTQRFTVRAAGIDSIDLSEHAQLRDPEGPTDRFNPVRTEWAFYVADTADADAVVAELETQLSGAEWATVEYRHTLAEYDDAEYMDDPDYYHPVHTIRSTPTLSIIDGYTLGVEADVVIDGSETSIDTTIDIDPVSDGYSRTDTIDATADGVSINDGGVTVGTVTVKEPVEGIPEAGIETVQYPDATADSGTPIRIGTEPESKGTTEWLHGLEQRIESLEGK